MKKVFTLLTFLVITQVNAQPVNGLIAHWNFAGNANDASGKAHNGTSTNVTYTTGKGGGNNTAAVFNGTNSYITVPYQADMNVSNYSICAVIKPMGYYSGPCQSNMIVSRGTEFQPGYYRLSFYDNAFDNHNCSIRDTSKNVFVTNGGAINTSNPNFEQRYSPTIVTNNWYCVTGTYNGDSLKIYVNGVLKSKSKRVSGSVGSSTESLAIGASRHGNFGSFPYWLNGVIDDIRIYNRALSDEEVVSYCEKYDTSVVIKDTTKLTLCNDETFNLPYLAIPAFNTGNVFTAELSDPFGNFTNPVNIGSVTSSVDGQISCTIPPTATPGNGYKVRIISSNPARITELTRPVEIHNNQLPSITIARTPQGILQLNQTVTYVATPVNAGNNPLINWFRNGMQIPNTFGDTLVINTLNDGDTVYAQVVSNKPCALDLTAKSNVDTVEVASSVISMRLHNLLVYPNPSNGAIYISASDVTAPQLHTNIYNAAGQLIHNETININNRQLYKEINLSGQPAGIYLLRIFYEGRQENIRLTITD